MKTISDIFTEALQKPDTKPYYYDVGQVVRVKSTGYAATDGQTPKFWLGAKCKVISRTATVLLKEHFYKLQHDNGAIDDFREEEIDLRFSKKV